MKKVRIGILGLGAISGIYLENLSKLFREVEIIGVYDLITEKQRLQCGSTELPAVILP